jgi:hypothetical protein
MENPSPERTAQTLTLRGVGDLLGLQILGGEYAAIEERDVPEPPLCNGVI